MDGAMASQRPSTITYTYHTHDPGLVEFANQDYLCEPGLVDCQAGGRGLSLDCKRENNLCEPGLVDYKLWPLVPKTINEYPHSHLHDVQKTYCAFLCQNATRADTRDIFFFEKK